MNPRGPRSRPVLCGDGYQTLRGGWRAENAHTDLLAFSGVGPQRRQCRDQETGSFRRGLWEALREMQRGGAREWPVDNRGFGL